MKVTNALVTWDDLATMGLTAKGIPPTGLGIANKAELIAAYYVDEAASPFSTYTSDRCPPYQTIQNTTTTTTTISASVRLCVTNGAVFPYPVTAGNGSASGTLWNNTGSTIYVYGVFNSGGNSSGNISADSGLVNGSTISFSGTITSSGQTFISTTYVALSNGAFVNWSLSKQDTLSSGATLRLGYALTIGGSVNNISESCAVPPPTTTTTTTCNPTPSWINNGAVFCSNCVSYQPQIDNNPCSATYNTTRNLNLGVGAPCNYSANWVDRDINTYYVCVGVDKYYQQIDTNPCSSTYNTTRTGALYQANSPSCGYVPPTTTTTTTILTGYMVTLAGAASSEFGTCSSGPFDFYITSSSVASAYNLSGDVSLLIGYILYENNILTVPTSYNYVSDSGGVIWQIISSSIVTTTGNLCP